MSHSDHKNRIALQGIIPKQKKQTMTWDAIKEQVEANHNVISLDMSALRDAAGMGRLGQLVIKDIENALAGMGLAHVPKNLPNRQHELARVYKRGTPQKRHSYWRTH